MRREDSTVFAPRARGAVLVCLFLCTLLPPAVGAPRIVNPVLVQAKKDLSARKPELVISALVGLLGTGIENVIRNEATLVLGQAYLDLAATRSRGKDDAAASAVYDTDIALLEPFLEATKDAKARTSADNLLSQAYMNNADANIRLKNYDKALLALQSFSAKYPERFDQANGKVRNIFAIRETYTKLASDIRDRVLKPEGASDPEVPGMIERLKKIDPYANKDILTLLLEVQTKARYLALFKSTMTKARAALDRQDVAGAVTDYLGGFAPDSTLPALFWQEFIDAGYDIIDKLDSATGQVMAVGADGKPRMVVVDGNGRVLKTDAEGRPVKGPGGYLVATDSSGAPLSYSFHDYAGQRQIDSTASIVTFTAALANKAADLVKALAGDQGRIVLLVDTQARLRDSLGSGDPATISESLPEALSAFADYNASRLELASINQDMAGYLASLPRNRFDGKPRSGLDYLYFDYAGYFLGGRQAIKDYESRNPDTDPLWRPEPERGKTEGMIGSLFSQSYAELDATEAAFKPLLESSWTTARGAWDAGRWSDAEAEFTRYAALASPARQAFELWHGLSERAVAAELQPEDLARIAAKDADLAVIDNLSGLATATARLARLRLSVVALRGRFDGFAAELASPSSSPRPLAERLAAIRDFRTELSGYEDELQKESGLAAAFKSVAAKASASLSSFSLPAAAPPAEELAWEERVSASVAEARSDEIALVSLSTGLEVAALEAELKDRDRSISEAAALIQGDASPVKGREGLRDPYPTRSSLILGDEEARIAALAAGGRELGGRIGTEVAWIREAPPVQAVTARDLALVRAGEALQARRGALLAEAETRKKAAAKSLAAADSSFARAETLLADATDGLSVVARRQASRTVILNDVGAARATAYTNFLDGMNTDFDIPTWDAGQARYAAIGKGVNDALDQYAKLEVIRLLGDAQHSYDIGNFDAAFETLNGSTATAGAVAIWKERYPAASYPPLDYLLNLVRMARDTGNTRVIKQTDPLYREMTQYLSLARLDFDKGVSLAKAGRTADAKVNFDRAQSIIRNVTKTFPLNADAGFLRLQILQATNPVDFRASLPNLINDAAALLKADPFAGYARIADLSRIEPTNAQIGRLLVQAEIATGKRKAPLTAAQVAQAQRLTDQARQLRTTDVAQATRLLAQALGIDPNNQDARSLSLEIQTVGGGPEKTLNIEDSRRLAQATLFFSLGQYNQARDTLDTLLQNDATKTREVIQLDSQLKQLNY